MRPVRKAGDLPPKEKVQLPTKGTAGTPPTKPLVSKETPHMKKLALLPIAALAFTAACSDTSQNPISADLSGLNLSTAEPSGESDSYHGYGAPIVSRNTSVTVNAGEAAINIAWNNEVPFPSDLKSYEDKHVSYEVAFVNANDATDFGKRDFADKHDNAVDGNLTAVLVGLRPGATYNLTIEGMTKFGNGKDKTQSTHHTASATLNGVIAAGGSSSSTPACSLRDLVVTSNPSALFNAGGTEGSGNTQAVRFDATFTQTNCQNVTATWTLSDTKKGQGNLTSAGNTFNNANYSNIFTLGLFPIARTYTYTVTVSATGVSSLVATKTLTVTAP